MYLTINEQWLIRRLIKSARFVSTAGKRHLRPRTIKIPGRWTTTTLIWKQERWLYFDPTPTGKSAVTVKTINSRHDWWQSQLKPPAIRSFQKWEGSFEVYRCLENNWGKRSSIFVIGWIENVGFEGHSWTQSSY